MRTVDELVQSIDPIKLRQALTEKKDQIEMTIASLVIDYQLEAKNDTMSGTARDTVLEAIKARIDVFQAALDEIDRRLAGADDALRGGDKDHG